MTELVKYAEPRSSLQIAGDVWPLANRISNTEFVPKDLRGRPEAVLACILVGHELGVDPMQALAKIHIIEGRPALSAEMMRALILRAGHDLTIEEETETRCVIVAQRAGSPRETRMTWTMDMARKANLTGKQNWQKYPGAMLLARCTAKIARAVFPDVLAGFTYTAEELSDGAAASMDDLGFVIERDPDTTAAATSSVSAGRAATRGATTGSGEAPVMAAPQAPPSVPLPGDDDDITDAELVEPSTPPTPAPAPAAVVEPEPVDEPPVVEPEPPATIEPEPPTPHPLDDYTDPDPPGPPDDGRAYSGPQIVAMRLGDKGITDRGQRLNAVSNILGHLVETSKDLPPADVSTVLRYIDDGGDLNVEPFVGNGGTPAEPVPDAAPPARRGTAVTPPDEWDGDRWRTFIKGRSMKAVKVMNQAAVFAAAAGVSVGTLDDIKGTGIAAELVGWIEDQ